MYAIHKVRMQCHYLAKALQIRLDNAPNELDWRGCCQKAVMAMKMNGTIMANNADTVMGWYRSFREERKFPNPSKGKGALPPFLQANPEAAMFIQAYAKENLKDLDSKLILEYLHDTLIPKLMKDENVTNKKKYLQNFEEEQTLLQKMVEKMSNRPGQFFLDRSPKCHCELAGEGIEYAWGCSKNWYRDQPMSEKKGKKNFIALVQRAISQEQLTTVRIRKFSRRARQYICAYRAMQHENNDNASLAIDPEMLPRVEKVLKEFRAHRCALDFDHKFCKAIQDEDNNN